MPGSFWAIKPKSKVHLWCLNCAFWFQCIASLSAVFPKSAQADFIDLRCTWATQPWELKSDVYHGAQVFWARFSSVFTGPPKLWKAKQQHSPLTRRLAPVSTCTCTLVRFNRNEKRDAEKKKRIFCVAWTLLWQAHRSYTDEDSFSFAFLTLRLVKPGKKRLRSFPEKNQA